MSLVAHYCQRVVAFRDGLPVFTGTPVELFASREILQKTGLCAPTPAALSARIRERNPDFPFLLTIEQWKEALCLTPAD
jgi:hypothetical protein